MNLRIKFPNSFLRYASRDGDGEWIEELDVASGTSLEVQLTRNGDEPVAKAWLEIGEGNLLFLRDGGPAAADAPVDGEFVFRDGKLHPQRFMPASESPDLDDCILGMGFVKESSINMGDTVLYAGKSLRWILLIGEAGQCATVLIEGWVNFFDAMRYFAPTIRFNELGWAAAAAEARGNRKA